MNEISRATTNQELEDEYIRLLIPYMDTNKYDKLNQIIEEKKNKISVSGNKVVMTNPV